MIARRPRQIAKRERQPAEVIDDPVADVTGELQTKINLRYRTNHDAFVTMLRAGASPHNPKFSVYECLADWWSIAFPGRRFPPPEGGYANELALAVQYGLLMNGYQSYGAKPPDRFKRNHDAAVDLRFGDLRDKLQEILDIEEKSILGQMFINPKPEQEQCPTSSARRPKRPQRRSVPLPASQPIARRPRRNR